MWEQSFIFNTNLKLDLLSSLSAIEGQQLDDSISDSQKQVVIFFDNLFFISRKTRILTINELIIVVMILMTELSV